MSKRVFDIMVSLATVVLLLPLFVLIIIVIRLSSKGPAVFRQERAGKEGKPFVFYKFRTMKSDVDPFGISPYSAEDPRLTKTGKLLREFSLDELPQLFNVLKGDMSIVGPRPLFVWQMLKWNEHQKKRLLVKPGITGLAQISGRGLLSQEEKFELDIRYVEMASISTDIKIILATIIQVFTRKNIYEKRYMQVREADKER